MNKCFCCGAEVPEDCPNCWSGHVRVGQATILWNGFVAKVIDVAWCQSCDEYWFVSADGKRTNVCRDCRERLLAVDQPQAELADRAAA